MRAVNILAFMLLLLPIYGCGGSSHDDEPDMPEIPAKSNKPGLVAYSILPGKVDS